MSLPGFIHFCSIGFGVSIRNLCSDDDDQRRHRLVCCHAYAGRTIWPMIWYSEHAIRQDDSHALDLILHNVLLLRSSLPADKICLPSGHTSSSAAQCPLGSTRG